MQTRFSTDQLADPALASCEPILRNCVHCGFCSATCPTYVLLGDELDSPRGRIYLIKDMLEHSRPATAQVARHIDRCLSCLGCMTTCPSGVHYQHLIDHARVHVERTLRRPRADRWLRSALAWVLPYPNRFKVALVLAAALRPLVRVLPSRWRPAVELVPRPPRSASAGAETPAEPADAPSSGRRVAVLTGCVQQVLGSEINAATIRVLRRAGAEVVTVPGCCGAVVHHLGRETQSLALAAGLIERLHADLAAGRLDAIAVNASGCGTQLKDYGYLFRHHPDLAEKARAVAAQARDVTEVLTDLGLPAPTGAGARMKVAYHSACSMQHGQKLEAPPRDLLRRAGYAVAEIEEGHLCCGSAGTYNLLQPEIATQLRHRKLANIEHTGARVVAAGNIGCILQLGAGAPVPVVHTIELLDWATGGPRPPALQPEVD